MPGGEKISYLLLGNTKVGHSMSRYEKTSDQKDLGSIIKAHITGRNRSLTMPIDKYKQSVVRKNNDNF